MSLVSFLEESVHLEVHLLLLRGGRFTWIRSGLAGFKTVWSTFPLAIIPGLQRKALMLSDCCFCFQFNRSALCTYLLPAARCMLGRGTAALHELKSSTNGWRELCHHQKGHKGLLTPPSPRLSFFLLFCSLFIALAWGISAFCTQRFTKHL